LARNELRMPTNCVGALEPGRRPSDFRRFARSPFDIRLVGYESRPHFDQSGRQPELALVAISKPTSCHRSQPVACSPQNARDFPGVCRRSRLWRRSRWPRNGSRPHLALSARRVNGSGTYAQLFTSCCRLCVVRSAFRRERACSIVGTLTCRSTLNRTSRTSWCKEIPKKAAQAK